MRRSAPSADDVRRLHFVNALFAQVTGHDLYLAEQIKEAITFSLAELQTQSEEHPEFAAKFDAAFNAAAAELLARQFAHLPRHGFFHWDAALTLASAPYRESTLLVTNLRPAIIPPARRATAKRRRDYDEAIEFIQALTAARISSHASLQLLFL